MMIFLLELIRCLSSIFLKFPYLTTIKLNEASGMNCISRIKIAIMNVDERMKIEEREEIDRNFRT
jgi:hypothetical protein